MNTPRVTMRMESSVFQAILTYPDGRRRMRTTGQYDRDRAKAWATQKQRHLDLLPRREPEPRWVLQELPGINDTNTEAADTRKEPV